MINIEFDLCCAEEKDASALCELIRELAVYEKNALAPITVDNVRAFGFGKEKRFSAELVKVKGQAVAYALYYFTFRAATMKPVLYLEDLYVRPEYRRKGIAKALVRRLQELAQEKGADYFELSVFDWNVAAQTFYESLGGELFPGILTIRFSSSK